MIQQTKLNIQQAYRYCQNIATSHYENFPVASKLLPRRLRQPIMVIYAFARTADDLADEGEDSNEQRLQNLQAFEQKLRDVEQGKPSDELLFIALNDVIQRFNIPYSLFYDLLSAFQQDVQKNRYQHVGEVMDYCRRSANPIGRIYLILMGRDSEKNNAYSDGICSALQLINFLQDVQQDLVENDRIYIPMDEMESFGVKLIDLKAGNCPPAMQQLLEKQRERARKMLKAGAPLIKQLKGRSRFELSMIVFGGMRILQRLHETREQCFARPRLRKRDWGWIVWRSFFPK
jgi:squalene synthase HpnC